MLYPSIILKQNFLKETDYKFIVLPNIGLFWPKSDDCCVVAVEELKRPVDAVGCVLWPKPRFEDWMPFRFAR